MKKTLLVAVLTLTALAALAASGRSSAADELILNNGDRLQGSVTKAGNDYIVIHPVLGEVTLPGKDVAKVVRGSSTAIARQAAAAAPATDQPLCTRCPVPAAEVKSVRKKAWTFWIGVGFSNESGNTEKFQLNVDTEASYSWGKNKILGRINSFYEEAQGIQTEGKYFSTVVYTRQLSHRGSFFAKWLFDRDDFADILYRTGWFVGYGYDFIKRDKTTLTGALGAGYVTESRRDVPVLHTAAFIARVDYNHEFRSGDSFRAMAYVIPYLDQTELSPVRFEMRYVHPLRKNLDIVGAFLLDYVSDPPFDIKPYDTKLTFSIRWNPL